MSKPSAAPDVLKQVGEYAAKFKGREDMLIEILKAIQPMVNNTLSEDVAHTVAYNLGVPVTRVYEASTFYAFFSTKARGKYVIRMCKSAPCHVKGAKEVLAAFEKQLGIKCGQTTKDGKFTLETCECLGVCDLSPAVLINDDLHGNLTPSKVREVLAKY